MTRARLLVVAVSFVAACASVKTEGGGATGKGGSAPTTGAGGAGGTLPPYPGAGGAGGAPPTQPGVCSNLQCRQGSCKAGACTQTPCPNGGTTSVSGTVFDPAGRVPLYNVVVYVPNKPLAPLHEGAACETCSGNFSGSPIAVTLSGTDGKFKLDDVPVGADVPIVVQIGKWRRQFVMPNVAACVDTPITDTTLTRLPRNKSEGNIPQIALATGGSDALECLLRRAGIDDAEFTNDSGNGRVHLYQGTRASPTLAVGGVSTPLRGEDSLWTSAANMMKYDMVLMACPGDDSPTEGRTAPQYAAVRGYADMGGRIYGSHFHTNWIKSEDGEPNAGYPQVVKFPSGAGPIPAPAVLTVVDTFPKGMALRDWLVNVGASTTRGQLPVMDAEHTVDMVLMGQEWLWTLDANKNNTHSVEYFSFTTPIGQPECGRMIFSNVHSSQGGGTSAAIPFPTRCGTTTELSAQEKALEFMLFDISSCVQKDDAPVQPPPVVE